VCVCVCVWCLVLAADVLTFIPAAVCYCLCCLTSHLSRTTQVCFELDNSNFFVSASVARYYWYVIFNALTSLDVLLCSSLPDSIHVIGSLL